MKWRAISQIEMAASGGSGSEHAPHQDLGSLADHAWRSSLSPSIADFSSVMKSAELTACSGIQLHAPSCKYPPCAAEPPPMHASFGG